MRKSQRVGDVYDRIAACNERLVAMLVSQIERAIEQEVRVAMKGALSTRAQRPNPRREKPVREPREQRPGRGRRGARSESDTSEARTEQGAPEAPPKPLFVHKRARDGRITEVRRVEDGA